MRGSAPQIIFWWKVIPRVIGWALRSCSPPWRFANIVEEIWDLANLTSAPFSHVKREANGVTDMLAKDGVKRQHLLFSPFSD